jgi:hypothetical protein
MVARIIGPLLLATQLVSCATGEPMRRVDTSGDCVDSIAALTAHAAFVPDPANPRKAAPAVQFADRAGCLERDERREGVALFRLDAVPAPSMTTVTMWSDPRGTLAAKVELLDADFNVVRVHGFSEFTRRGMQYTFTAFDNAGGPDVRYLLISPDLSQIGGSDQQLGSLSSTVYVGTGFWMHGSERAVARPLTDAGNLTVVQQAQGSTPIKR